MWCGGAGWWFRGRVVVYRALEMLHESHPGVVKMKTLARSYLWWPGMDQEIERCVKECVACQSSRKDPPVIPLHPWAPDTHRLCWALGG